MEIQGVGTSGSKQEVQNLFGAAGGVLGKDDFLKLLVTQLSNQDPLDPQSNEQYIAQLAQFSALEQAQNMNATLQANSILTQSVNNALTASLIGKEVRAVGNTIVADGTNGTQVPVNLEKAGQVTLTIKDADGKVVKVIKTSELKGGENKIEWDGRDERGSLVPAGSYSYSAEATGVDGEPIRVDPYFVGVVSGVKFVGGNAVLMVGDREVPLGSVIQIGGSS